MAFIVYSMRNCVAKIIREVVFFRHGWRLARPRWLSDSGRRSKGVARRRVFPRKEYHTACGFASIAFLPC